MPNQPPNNERDAVVKQPQPQKDKSILGLSTDELAGLSVDELMSNKVAITMLIHYYKLMLRMLVTSSRLDTWKNHCWISTPTT